MLQANNTNDVRRSGRVKTLWICCVLVVLMNDFCGRK